MAIYVYKIADGSLYSWSPNDTDPVADATTLAANGLAVVSGLAAIDPSHSWDAVTKTIISVTPLLPKIWIPTYQFILLFTAAENAAIRASTDNTVQHFFDALRATQQINLNDPIVQNGVSYLASVNLLTAASAALILSGKASA